MQWFSTGRGSWARLHHVAFTCSLSACVGSRYSSFLPQPKGMHVGLIGNSELSVGVNVSLNYCLSLCVSPVIDWGVSYDMWDRIQPCRDPEVDKWENTDGWINPEIVFFLSVSLSARVIVVMTVNKCFTWVLPLFLRGMFI